MNARCLARISGISHESSGSAAASKGSGHMSFVAGMIGTAERVPLTDVVIRAAIQRLCSRTASRLASGRACARAEPQILVMFLQGAGIHAAGGRGRSTASDHRTCRSCRRAGDLRTRLCLGLAGAVDGAAVSLAEVTAMSNPSSQREFIEHEAASRGLKGISRDHRRYQRVRLRPAF